jgi:phage tail sheath protein FI
MAFQISPGVNVSEIDLTAIVPAVQTTAGAFAGQFRWGPVEQRVLISNEAQLVGQYNKPNNTYFADFFTAANFLAYGDTLYTVRVNNTGLKNAITAGNSSITLIKSEDDYDNNYSSGISNVGNLVAKYPGDLGNSLKYSICPSATAFESTLSGTYTVVNGNTGVVFSANQAAVISVGDLLQLGTDKEVYSVATVDAGGLSVTLDNAYTGDTVNASTALNRRWEYYNFVSTSPGTSPFATTRGGSNDQIHVVLVDEDGVWTGVKGQVVERYESLSLAGDARTDDGSTNYYKEVLNRQSKYVWWTAHDSALTNAGTDALGTTFAGGNTPITASFISGSDGSAATTGQKQLGYDLFKSAEEVDISLILGGASNSATAIHIINNICEYRKDCIVCLSPEQTDVVNNTAYVNAQVDDSVAFRNTLPSSSFAVLDSGFKYQYDKYNDAYRWVPLNGDVAGTMVRTDETRDPWYSPAGLNRGRIKNVTSLAFNPNKTARDQLYKNGINPVTTFPGEGTVLFGDKTLLGYPSAFDRINVRRLFIVLEKAIAIAARQSLFEFNDDFTRGQFVNLVEPFLRDVQGRRGIFDFRVVCDETNNTPEIIDRNEFVGDIYVKPARSINFIQLNFVAVRTGVEFEEVVGQFG